jgi:SAM-dependent methyltransferase
LRRQFEAEKELADRLRRAARVERPALYRSLYEELFRRAPGHERLEADRDGAVRARAVEAQMRLLRPWLEPRPGVFLEIGPGSGWLAFAMCSRADRVLAVDISDQLAPAAERPANFRFLASDGVSLPLENGAADLAFSYQVIEHQHPDDVAPGLAEVRRVLKPGGRYVLATPHRYSGPHDISRHFSDEPLGLHLKEWTYRELGRALEQAGFSEWRAYRFGRPLGAAWLNRLNLAFEAVCGILPRPLQRRFCRRLFQGIALVAFTTGRNGWPDTAR